MSPEDETPQESQQKLAAVVQLLSKQNKSTNFEEDSEKGSLSVEYKVDVNFLKMFLLTFVEEIKSIPHATKGKY